MSLSREVWKVLNNVLFVLVAWIVVSIALFQIGSRRPSLDAQDFISGIMAFGAIALCFPAMLFDLYGERRILPAALWVAVGSGIYVVISWIPTIDEEGFFTSIVGIFILAVVLVSTIIGSRSLAKTLECPRKPVVLLFLAEQAIICGGVALSGFIL